MEFKGTGAAHRSRNLMSANPSSGLGDGSTRDRSTNPGNYECVPPACVCESWGFHFSLRDTGGFSLSVCLE